MEGGMYSGQVAHTVGGQHIQWAGDMCRGYVARTVGGQHVQWVGSMYLAGGRWVNGEAGQGDMPRG